MKRELHNTINYVATVYFSVNDKTRKENMRKGIEQVNKLEGEAALILDFNGHNGFIGEQ